jgi:hypothetical protein
MNKENITSAEYVYDLQGHKGIIKVITSDNEYWIPNNATENKDFQAIQEWIADGGTVIDNGGTE